ncbi:hypothetical protein DM01DRAFT_1333403 [Hesseltinella vesiculosa]|uniref:Uncharacterized protein n=1 Tax=Hesseltinella vesiculosa TaxID=101127 RepID=A0A1X2GPV8_9FUNG|nr:hypothetical protein DM01DRAFT_1333403 [Hesseltinella vesiculosa]
MPQDSSPAQQRRMVAVYINDLSPDQPREIDRARKINFLPLSWIHLSKFLGLPEKLTDAIVDYGVDIIVHGQSGIALAVKKVVDENACNPPIATSSVREVVHLCDRQTIFSSLKELKQQDVKNNRHTFYEFGQRSLTDLSILPPKEFFPRGKAGLITTDIQNLIDNPFLLSKIVNTVKMRNEYSVGQSWKFVLHPHFLYQLQQSSSGK